MKRVSFKQIDVFTTAPFTGNPAAVVLDGVHLTTEEMQAIAQEMNLSETVFVLPPTVPGADYRVRFFSPRNELPFAGHPTLATAYAIISDGNLFNRQIPEVVYQECGIGTVEVLVERRNSGLFFLMKQATPLWINIDISRQLCAAMLGCIDADVMNYPVEIVSTGVNWLIIPVASLKVVQALKPNLALIDERCHQIGAYGVTTFCLDAEYQGHQVHVRSFAPGAGVPEDPVCGTGNGSIAAYLAHHGLLEKSGFEYIAEQGAEVGRPGLVTIKVRLETDQTWRIQVGGQAIQVLEGELSF